MYQFPDNYQWLFPWCPLDSSYVVANSGQLETLQRRPAKLLINELHRETAEGHVLYGETVTAVAYYTLTHKDFIFTSRNPDKPIACVHLTWSPETDPKWPWTTVYPTLEDWTRQMEIEHRKYRHLEAGYE